LNSSSSITRREERLQTLLWWLPVIAWAAIIFFMSTRTFGSPFSNRLLRDLLSLLHLKVSHHTFYILATGFRKLGHFTEYGVFAIFLYHALGREHGRAWNPKKALACILLAGLYSLTDEFHQRFVPGRGPSIVDSGFDTVGATLGMAVVYFMRRGRIEPAADVKEESSAGGNKAPSS
jgi:VanZ family protein